MDKKKINIVLKYIILIIGVVIILFPMYLTIVTAFKTTAESSKDFFGFPKRFYIGNFKEVISKSNYLTYVFNSSIITGVSGVLMAILFPMISYSIARNMKNKKYYKFLYYFILMGIFIPFQVKMVPIVKLMSSINMMSKTGLIILYLSGGVCEGVFLLVAYIKSIPYTLEEAAYIDGASVFQTFFHVTYPLIKPMTATVLVTKCLWIWNDFLLPLLILNRSKSNWTLPLFQYNFKTQYSFNYNLAFASFALSMLPIILLYVFIQNHVISGLTNGALKD